MTGGEICDLLCFGVAILVLGYGAFGRGPDYAPPELHDDQEPDD